MDGSSRSFETMVALPRWVLCTYRPPFSIDKLPSSWMGFPELAPELLMKMPDFPILKAFPVELMVSAEEAMLELGSSTTMALPGPGRIESEWMFTAINPAGRRILYAPETRSLSMMTSSVGEGIPSGNQLSPLLQRLSRPSPSHFFCPIADADKHSIIPSIKIHSPLFIPFQIDLTARY